LGLNASQSRMRGLATKAGSRACTVHLGVREAADPRALEPCDVFGP
jgi:hypothetical protein